MGRLWPVLGGRGHLAGGDAIEHGLPTTERVAVLQLITQRFQIEACLRFRVVTTNAGVLDQRVNVRAKRLGEGGGGGQRTQ